MSHFVTQDTKLQISKETFSNIVFCIVLHYIVIDNCKKGKQIVKTEDLEDTYCMLILW